MMCFAISAASKSLNLLVSNISINSSMELQMTIDTREQSERVWRSVQWLLWQTTKPCRYWLSLACAEARSCNWTRCSTGTNTKTHCWSIPLLWARTYKPLLSLAAWALSHERIQTLLTTALLNISKLQWWLDTRRALMKHQLADRNLQITNHRLMLRTTWNDEIASSAV